MKGMIANMKKIGFIGAYDKANFIIYTSKVLSLLGYKVLVVDTSSIQKIKYVIPSINPTKSYITNFEDIDFAVGFGSWEEIEMYLGIKFDSNDENDPVTNKKISNDVYDYVLLDVDSSEMLENFEIEKADKNYFVTSFDMFSLKKGLRIFENLTNSINLTKIEFSYESSKEDEEYLNYLSMEYKINWNNYALYFQILGDDNKVFEENQRLEKIGFRRLSINYKESLSYAVQDVCKEENISKIKRTMKD